MRRWTIARALVAVGVLAVGLAALKQATPLWYRITFSLTVLILLVGLLGAIVKARTAGGWIGFALFGWVYFGLLIIPIGHGMLGGTDVLTDDLGRAVSERIHPQPVRPAGIPAEAGFREVWELAVQNRTQGAASSASATYLSELEFYNSKAEETRKIFHLLSCLILGALGAFLGNILAARREAEGPTARGTNG